jgi:hypothetical protein
MNIIIIAPKQEPFKWAPKTQNGDLWKTVHWLWLNFSNFWREYP